MILTFYEYSPFFLEITNEYATTFRGYPDYFLKLVFIEAGFAFQLIIADICIHLLKLTLCALNIAIKLRNKIPALKD